MAQAGDFRASNLQHQSVWVVEVLETIAFYTPTEYARALCALPNHLYAPNTVSEFVRSRSVRSCFEV